VDAFTIYAAGQTRQGQRSVNEDRYAIDAERHVYAVADGMGGSSAGERAAGLTIEVLLRRLRSELSNSGQVETVVQRAFTEANQAVTAHFQQSGTDRGGATVVLAFRYRGQMVVAWVGDCAAYHLSGEVVEQLSTVHSVAEALVRTGTLTEEQARHSPWRTPLYRYVGSGEWMEPFEFRSFRPQAGDRLILATDGMTSVLEPRDLLDISRANPDPQACADHLVERALGRGSRDNVTVVVADFLSVRMHPDWLTWNDGAIVQLARALDETQEFDGMPILADALEDAGCTDTAILEHCRGPGPHVRGCWVVDLILGNQ
jgi:protein phosphatase